MSYGSLAPLLAVHFCILATVQSETYHDKSLW